MGISQNFHVVQYSSPFDLPSHPRDPMPQKAFEAHRPYKARLGPDSVAGLGSEDSLAQTERRRLKQMIRTVQLRFLSIIIT